MMTEKELQRIWQQIPPNMVRVTTGTVKEGDYFYIDELGASGPVPKSGWGEPILNSLIARPNGPPNYQYWLGQCAGLAMRSEWLIDAGNPDWLAWFKEGKTPEEAVGLLFAQVRDDAAPATAPERVCAYCGAPAQGNFSIHRDGFCKGPEVDLCDECGGRRPSPPEIWARISQRPIE